MIDFTRAFNSAWERMVIILFRPFDLGKWCLIGFSAFLAGLLSGGNGINLNSFGNNRQFGAHQPFSHPQPNFTPNNFYQSTSNWFSNMQSWLVISMVAAIILVILIVIVLFYWLGSRGQFLFLDNLARNRGAIADPWRRYERSGNRLFLFYMAIAVLATLMAAPFFAIGFFMALPFLHHQQAWHSSNAIPFVVLGLVYLLIYIPLFILFFLFREWGIPLMFRNGLGSRAAFAATWRLIGQYPGTAFLFILIRFALFLALVVVSVITCCLTCCLAQLPYLGTVVLLPALIFIKCFSLDCLAQLGPECDVWTVDVPAGLTPAPLSPPPPLE